MPLFSNQLSVIRQYVSNAVGDLILVTAGTTVSNTSLVDTLLRQGADYYSDHKYKGYCYAGSAIGEERDVSAFATVGSVTFAPAFGTIVAADKFEFHYKFTEDDYRKAINQAIDFSVGGKYLIDVIDSTAIQLSANTYEYTLPTTMYFVHNIITEDAVSGGKYKDGAAIDPRDWRLISSRKLKLHERYGITADKYLRLEGQGVQANATIDTATIHLPMDWLVQKAITFLPLEKIQSNKLDKTYDRAMVSSAITPVNYPNPRGQKVME